MDSIFRLCVAHGRFAFVVLTALILSGVANGQTKSKDAPSKPKYGVNKPLGDIYTAANSVANEQTRLVLYRAPVVTDKSVGKRGVISVYLNDRYHTSLQNEAFSVICLTGKKADLRTRYLADITAEIQPEHDSRQTLTMSGGQSIYLRVAHTQSQKTRIDIVTAQIAAGDLMDARQQMHTLSRVPGAQPCREAQAAVFAFDPNVITFGSDAIFEAKKTDIDTISALGQQELKQIVEKINIKYKTFDDVKVHVVGFANDDDDETANQRLSTERAKSVRTFFKNQGLRTTTLTFEGRGSREKEKVDLFGLSPRRVEVEVAVEIR